MKNVRRGAQLSELNRIRKFPVSPVVKTPRARGSSPGWGTGHKPCGQNPTTTNMNNTKPTNQPEPNSIILCLTQGNIFSLSISYFWYTITVMCCILKLLKYLPTDQTEDQIMGSTQGASSQYLIRIHLPIQGIRVLCLVRELRSHMLPGN